MIASMLVAGIYFGRNLLGLLFRPYETYRRIINHGKLEETAYVALIILIYFLLASVVKTASFHPFLLTSHFTELATATLLGFGLAVGLLTGIGRAFGGVGGWREIILGWSYSLLPTTVWFYVTTLLYLILPPPRTTSLAGIMFSFLYLVFSVAILFWKLTLGFLTLRFGMKLDLLRIIAVGGISLVILTLYSVLTYRWGIFKIPFL